MDAGEENMKERIWLSMMEYSVLKEKMKENECRWPDGLLLDAPSSSAPRKRAEQLMMTDDGPRWKPNRERCSAVRKPLVHHCVMFGDQICRTPPRIVRIRKRGRLVHVS
jgi:hypothetical protein